MPTPAVTAVPSAVPAPPVAIPVVVGFDSGFDARWNAWIARGNAQEAEVRRRLQIALPLFAVMAAVVVYLLGR